ncbi:hypothetical protein ACFIQF_11585 [Comamonas sp. J-3]|uniref:hypothetical protein n=1 Tax=Comamonas trifloxystrobinivorans TaxID=3350256 RepID=UPI0037266A9B
MASVAAQAGGAGGMIPIKIDLTAVSTPDLLAMMRDIAAELETRLAEPKQVRVQAERPVFAMRVPAVDDADFVLMVAQKLRSGAYIKAGERNRVAEIAQEFGPWVHNQGCPTTHNAGDWKRKGEFASAPRARAK